MATPRVLVLEDDALDRELLGIAVAGRLEMTFACTKSEGLEKLRCGEFDAVVTDLGLRDSESRFDAVDAIRPAASCPVIVLTGIADPPTAIRLMQRGVQACLIKGVHDKDVVATVHRVIRLWRKSTSVVSVVPEACPAPPSVEPDPGTSMVERITGLFRK